LKVSFIITTKNEEKYIKNTLLSIRQQNSNIEKEIVVVDAMSTDKTVEIAKKYADIVLVRKSNIPEGKNIGAYNSSGKILVFVNADVILEKDWLKVVLKELEKNEVIAVCGLIKPMERSLKARIFMILWNFLIRILFMINFPHTSGETTLAVKREYFFKIGGFNSSLASFEDVDLGLRLSKLGKVKLIKNVYTIASLRRFEREGYLKWSVIWLATGLYYLFTKKSPLKHYPIVR
jgi:glycosyltransferase involved in cell wall biosynthesis